MGQPIHVGQGPDLALAEDEWEYEYDAAETEDFYFTLDLTTHVPNALAASTSRNAKHDSKDGTASVQGDGPVEVSSGHAARHQVQITDLHSQNPLIRFDDGIYNCYWSTDLGTQFHISEAGIVSTPRRPGTVLDVIGTSQTRLISKPAKLVPRQGRRRLATLGNASVNSTHNNNEDVTKEARPAQPISAEVVFGEPLKIDRAGCKDENAEAQASFLERLSEIKLKKGEKDQVPVINVRNYEPPANVAELREIALAKDAEKAKRRAEQAAAAEGDGQARQKQKRRRRTNLERGFVMASNTGPKAQSREQMVAPVALNSPVGTSMQSGLAIAAVERLPLPQEEGRVQEVSAIRQADSATTGGDAVHIATHPQPATTIQATTLAQGVIEEPTAAQSSSAHTSAANGATEPRQQDVFRSQAPGSLHEAAGGPHENVQPAAALTPSGSDIPVVQPGYSGQSIQQNGSPIKNPLQQPEAEDHVTG